MFAKRAGKETPGYTYLEGVGDFANANISRILTRVLVITASVEEMSLWRWARRNKHGYVHTPGQTDHIQYMHMYARTDKNTSVLIMCRAITEALNEQNVCSLQSIFRTPLLKGASFHRYRISEY